MSHYLEKRRSLFGNRVINAWNLLPDHIVILQLDCLYRLARLNFTL